MKKPPRHAFVSQGFRKLEEQPNPPLMPLIEGADRQQLQIFALEQLIGTNNPVRVIDAFVRALLKQRQGRAIERSEYEDYVAANAERGKANRELYRRRQAIVQHPFGTIKRSWGYTYTLLHGIEKVSGEFALIFTCYNLRRTMSILGVQGLLRRLQNLFSHIFRPWCTMMLFAGRRNFR